MREPTKSSLLPLIKEVRATGSPSEMSELLATGEWIAFFSTVKNGAPLFHLGRVV